MKLVVAIKKGKVLQYKRELGQQKKQRLQKGDFYLSVLFEC